MPDLGLKHIVLHNSYFNGMTVKLDADGHSNASGGNGAGKTSALNLIPVFYGYEPNQLVDQVADKEAFIDFYLPKQSSALIFEHKRADGYRLAVMYRHQSGMKIIYRLVRGGLEETFFSARIKPMMQSGEAIVDIFKRMRAEGIGVSKQIETITDYRGIIQNDRTLLRRKGDSVDYGLANEYCVGGPGMHMSHLDKMSYSILRRKDMFERLKRMIAETQFADIHIDARPDYLKDKTITSDIDAVRNFIDSEDKIKECINNHKDRLNTLTERNDTACFLGFQLVKANEEFEKVKANITALDTALAEEKEIYDKEMQDLTDSHRSYKSDANQLEIDLEAIYAEYDEWVNEKEIDSKKAQYLNIEQERRRQTSLEGDLKSLTSTIENLELEKKEQEQIAKAHLTEHKEQVALKKEPLNAEIDAIKAGLSESLEGLSKEKLKAIDELNAGDLSRQIANVKQEQAVAVLRSQSDIERPEDKQAVSALEEARGDCQTEATRLLERLQARGEEQKKLERQRDKEQGLFEQAREQSVREENKLNKLAKIAFPNTGTLLATLRQTPNWTANIGRVLNEDLLLRTDLQPSFNESNIETLYGWSVLLDKIDLPVYCADEAALKQRYETQQAVLRNAEKLKDDREVVAKALQLKVDEFIKETHPFAYKHRELSARLTGFDNELRSARDLAKRNATADKIRAEEVARELGEKVTELEEKQKTIRRQIDEDFNKRKIELTFKAESAVQSVEEHLTELDNSVEVAKQDYEAQLKRIELRFTEECVENGVDPDVIQALRESITEQVERVRTITGYYDEIERYKHFYKTRYEPREEMEESLLEARKKRDKASDDIIARNDAYQELKKKLAEEKAETGLIRDKLKTHVETGTNLVGLCGQYGENKETKEPIATLISSLERLIKEESDLKEKTLRGVGVAQQILTLFTGSLIYKAWQSLLHKRKESIRKEEYEIEFRLALPDDLEHLLNHDVPELRDVLIEQVRSVGESLSKYHDSLNTLNKDVDRVSRHLAKVINTNQRIENLSNIELQVTSVVKEGDYWKQLVEFNQQWVEWSLERAYKLPSKSLLNSIGSANDALKSARIKSDVNSLIRLRISLEENGRKAHATSAEELDAVSSNGISYLAILVIFRGMARYLCPNPDIAIHWPIDELAALSPESVARVFEMFDEAGIYCFSAFPSTDANLLKFFKHKKLIDRKTGVRTLKEKAASSTGELLSSVSMLVAEEAE